MRLALVTGVLAAALLLAGVIVARGDPERTPVPAIDLRGETVEVTTTEPGEEKPERKSRQKKNQAGGGGGSGANPAPAPPPVPAGDDDDDDEPDEDEGERDDDGDD